MPIYEYECLQCGEVTELLQSSRDAIPVYCDFCDHECVRIMSKGSFILKGDGFYKPSSD